MLVFLASRMESGEGGLMAVKPLHEDTNRYQQFIRNLVLLESEAACHGLHATARKINDAVREVGWEIERKIAASEKRAEKRKTK
jgi:hypothetical protein